MIFASQLGRLLAPMLLLWSTFLSAGEVKTTYGFTIRGVPVKVGAITEYLSRHSPGPVDVKPVWLVDDGMRRNFVASKLVPAESVQVGADPLGSETFEIKQLGRPKNVQIDNLGTFQVIAPLNKFGHTTYQIQTSAGLIPIVLGITEINPRHVQFEGQTHLWKFARSTNSFRYEELDPVIRNVIDENSQADRMAVARFYMLTEQFHYSLKEIEQIRRQFPELRQQINSLEVELQTVWASQLLGDLEARQQSGQHEFALLATNQFLATFRNLKPEILQRIRTIQNTEQRLAEDLEAAKYLLGDLQAQLDDPDLLAQARLIRTEILGTLDKSALHLLRPFLNFQNDESLSAREKLALAYSGWVLGAQNASTNFENSLRLWDARHLVLDYLRNADPTRDSQLLENITNTEGVGPTSLAALLEHLPPILETPGVVSAAENSPLLGIPEPQFLDLKAKHRLDYSSVDYSRISASQVPLDDRKDRLDDNSVDYSVMLPIEYNQNSEYPLIIELRPVSQTRQRMLTWWGEQAARRGYIVAAPEYLDPAKAGYDYSVASHQAIERVLRDAMKRFRIDSSRIYLAGHDAGGDAAFDFGMAHGDLFAGVIAISGECRYHCKATKDNNPELGLYVVSGELDRGLLSRNAGILNNMIRYGRDVIYVEYMGRGNESYYEEIHRLFDWMNLHRLDRKQTKVEAKITRPTEGRLFWLQANKLPDYIYTNDPATPGGSLRTSTLKGSIAASDSAQTIYLTGPREISIFLTPEIFDFNKPLTISRDRSGYRNRLVQPSIPDMLEDFRNRADRKNIVWAKIVLE